MSPLESRFTEFLARLEAADSRRVLRPGRPEGARVVHRGGRALLNFSSNDYLDLAGHPKLVARSREWTEMWGAGAGASRLVTGTYDLHEAVERKTARCKRSEAALLFASGYQANASILPALLDERLLGAPPRVFADLRIHASMHEGLRAAGVSPVFYRNGDLDDLEARIRKRAHQPGPRFILTESVFSMDGDQTDVAALTDIAKRWDAFVYLDEAHATGVSGPRGMGLSGGLPGGVHLAMGTFSKGLGGFGAYVAGSANLRHYLVNRCRGFIFSTALPPGILGAMDAALDLAPTMDEERAHLHRLADRLRRGLAEAGHDTGPSSTHIVPVILGENVRTLAVSAELEAAGILGVAIRPPSVPRGTGRIRFSLTAAHRDEDVDALLDALAHQRVAS